MCLNTTKAILTVYETQTTELCRGIVQLGLSEEQQYPPLNGHISPRQRYRVHEALLWGEAKELVKAYRIDYDQRGQEAKINVERCRQDQPKHNLATRKEQLRIRMQFPSHVEQRQKGFCA